MNIVNIAEEFSVYPGGRYPSDGKFSGEEFRQQFLEPYLAGGESVCVELDGTRGYGSSFLEEAFGGLIRCGYDVQTVLDNVCIVTSRPSLFKEVEGYIRDGGANDCETTGTE